MRNGTPHACSLATRRLERVQSTAHVGNDDEASAAIGERLRDVDVGAVDAQHELGAGVDSGR